MSARKTVLVTGAGSGIGRALAVEGANRGFEVVIAGRSRSSLRETQEMLRGHMCRLVVADVTTNEGREAIQKSLDTRLDILINNAGTLSVGHLSGMETCTLQRMVDTNLVAPIALTRDLLPLLRSAEGRIVNVGSVFGDIAYPYFAAYSATKFGLRGFSDAMRRELSGSGVGVTYIAPRATRTAAEVEFGPLVEPLQMTLDSPGRVAIEAWDAIESGKRESFPRGKERFFVRIQRLLPWIVDKAVGAQARSTQTLSALESIGKL